ncbi:putative sulfoacetate transporter SauU [Variibacter gotjawalensis]|uniref:Putative sulfoacetate transporter SauU n=1 Tax=Variibacter gotjawalensis TaxID=1333996 RepID=A0A0S3PQS9_9BRAD|nr:MFS transporter [Variibacter gotjawalensis]NIK48566.1 MFS family permease [Variibacter gotjawalensis]RZS50431.1 putative MFS family arabinose efflux permease [Variibacter gotjawalensis]BAT58265.1 putative sulfoacetate transporter SauU [Variibacter gotjawalensis]
MTPLAPPQSTREGWATHRLLALICAAHFVSHFYIVVLAPVLTLVRADYGVTYTQVGLAFFAFNLISALFQTHAGYLVDRSNAGAVLICGLVIGSIALASAASAGPFWLFVAMFALLGFGNTVYHPADYSLLAQRMPAARMSHAYALHTFAGMAGSAASPVLLLPIATQFGWRTAYFTAAAIGLSVAIVLAIFWRDFAGKAAPAPTSPKADVATPSGRALLFSPPVLVQLGVFTLLALMNAGVQNFSMPALESLRGVPLALSGSALTLYLVLSALGVLVGGYIASRTQRHDIAAVVCLAGFGLSALSLAFVDAGAAVLLFTFAIAGLVGGAIAPSRDMLVRAVTPDGSHGKVFAFVTNGFNIGGIASPLLFGFLLDHGHPQAVFVAAGLFALICVPLVLVGNRRS